MMKNKLTILLHLISFVAFSQCTNEVAEIGTDATVIQNSFETTYEDQNPNMTIDISNATGLITLNQGDFEKTIRFINYDVLIENNVVDIMTTKYLGDIVQISGDDAAGVFINPIYDMGANHAYPRVMVVTATAHGKTIFDEGSEWIDINNDKYYITQIVDANTLHFMSEDRGTGDIFDHAIAINGTTLVHSQNATNTATINVESTGGTQVFPGIRDDRTIQIKIDGVVTTADGTYFGEELELFETYTIPDPPSSLAVIIANVGSGVHTPINQGDAVCDVDIKRTWHRNGSMTGDYTVLFNQDADLGFNDPSGGYLGATQFIKMGSPAYPDEFLYFPNTLPINGVDYTDFIDFNVNPVNHVRFTPDTWDGPVTRMIEAVGTGTTKTVGFSHGFHYDQDLIINRDQSVDVAWELWNTGKSYPRFLSNKTITAGESYSITYFRNFFAIDNSITPSTKYSYYVAGEKFTYIDFHSNGTYNFQPDANYCNRSIVESKNLTYTEEMGQIQLTKAGAENYGYALIKETN